MNNPNEKCDPDFTEYDAVRKAIAELEKLSMMLEDAGLSSEADNLAFYAQELRKNHNVKGR